MAMLNAYDMPLPVVPAAMKCHRLLFNVPLDRRPGTRNCVRLRLWCYNLRPGNPEAAQLINEAVLGTQKVLYRMFRQWQAAPSLYDRQQWDDLRDVLLDGLCRQYHDRGLHFPHLGIIGGGDVCHMAQILQPARGYE